MYFFKFKFCHLILEIFFTVKKWPYLNQELTIRSQVLQEAEFYVLEVMDCCLIVYHPYRPLNQMIQVKNMFNNKKNFIVSYLCIFLIIL